MRLRRIPQCMVVAFAVFVAGIGALYQHWIGFPRTIAGHRVHPRVTWYWTGYPPLGYPYPAIVQYVYRDESGRDVRHGPLVERSLRGSSVVLSRTGFYLEDQPDVVFTECQTYWGTKLSETTYDHGKQINRIYYPVPPLKQAAP